MQSLVFCVGQNDTDVIVEYAVTEAARAGFPGAWIDAEDIAAAIAGDDYAFDIYREIVNSLFVLARCGIVEVSTSGNELYCRLPPAIGDNEQSA